jgi:hypothetical protein
VPAHGVACEGGVGGIELEPPLGFRGARERVVVERELDEVFPDRGEEEGEIGVPRGLDLGLAPH